MGKVIKFRLRAPKPRREDIEPLIGAFRTANRDLQRAVVNDTLSRQLAAEEALRDIQRAYQWPAAVRAELKLSCAAINQWQPEPAQTQVLRSLELLESWALTCPEILL